VIVVLDTNVIVSALLQADSSSGRVLQMALGDTVFAAYNSAMYAEYQKVLFRRKFLAVREQAEIILERIVKDWTLVGTEPLLAPLPDPTDLPFLETALTVRADALITGNLRHFPAWVRQGIKVVNPREFMDQLYHS
jgi:uncharacterized protein